MAIRNIIKLGDPRLRQKSEEVAITELQSKEIKNLIRDMNDSMNAAGGVGLAAPQIGVLKRVAIIGSKELQETGENQRYLNQPAVKYRVLINPIIEPLTDKTQGFFEGCLSIPGMRGFVERPNRIKLTYYDTNEDQKQEIIDGFEAIVVQHECDHLDGVLYVDRLKDWRLFGYDQEMSALIASSET